MLWIKRNLFFVISAVVGLLLTGYCAYLLFGAMHDNASAAADYDQAKNQLIALQQRNPVPSVDNIDAVKSDETLASNFLADFKKRFVPFPPPPPEDAKGFGSYLDNTLVRFRMGASNAGVQLPAPDYAFAFSSLIGQLTPHTADIAPWMQQLEEIGAILDILYAAKINSLESLSRAPVSADDGGPDLLVNVPAPGPWWTVTPYKISFRGFSEELAGVLEGFARSSNCFIIKTIDVMEDRSANQSSSSAPTQPTIMDQRGGMTLRPQFTPPAFYNNPRGGRGIVSPPATTATAATASSVAVGPPQTILSESPLVVTLTVDVVKLKSLGH